MLRAHAVIVTVAMLTLGSLAVADDERAVELRVEAKRLMLEARELKEAGKADRSEEVFRRAKELLAEADKISNVEGKPKPQKQEKEPKSLKEPKKVKPESAEPKKEHPEKQPAKEHEKGAVKPDVKVPEKQPAKEHEKGAVKSDVKAPVKQPVKAPGHPKPARVDGKPFEGPDAARDKLIILQHSKQGARPHAAEERMMHMSAAAKHLREAGINDVADELERQIGMMKERLQNQLHPRGDGDLVQVIEGLRQEVAELRRAVREMRAEIDRR